MLSFKRKERFDKNSTRGIVYTGLAALGIGYELIFSEEIRVMLIIGYSIVIAFGLLYIWYIKPREHD